MHMRTLNFLHCSSDNYASEISLPRSRFKYFNQNLVYLDLRDKSKINNYIYQNSVFLMKSRIGTRKFEPVNQIKKYPRLLFR
ncbi:hypothetical protein C2G38_528567 [Gigaspora rosea]|uniref:Uncharacterized protein n=1 Tax=Gigaspora rosea TaxID=44941 RepID=A0A397U7P7_9GLOM|nr:hypothetical protein C2G38_528567 [Gigaspora rosea]